MDAERVSAQYAACADKILRAAWHLTGNRHIAEDCTQEAFLRLLQQPDTMSDAHILPWLICTAKNIARDYLRSAEYTRTVPLGDCGQETAGSDGAAERAVLRAVQKLPEKYRLPLQFHFVEGYTIQETAALLHLRMNTVASRIRRGRKLLQKAYEEEVIL